jgi:hypothetical protein
MFTNVRVQPRSGRRFVGALDLFFAVGLPLVVPVLALSALPNRESWHWLPLHVLILAAAVHCLVSVAIQFCPGLSAWSRRLIIWTLAIIWFCFLTSAVDRLYPSFFGSHPPWRWQTCTVSDKFQFAVPLGFEGTEHETQLVPDNKWGSEWWFGKGFYVTYHDYTDIAPVKTPKETDDYLEQLLYRYRDWTAPTKWTRRHGYDELELYNCDREPDICYWRKMIVKGNIVLMLNARCKKVERVAGWPKKNFEVTRFFDSLKVLSK